MNDKKKTLPEQLTEIAQQLIDLANEIRSQDEVESEGENPPGPPPPPPPPDEP